jgi:glycine cleavage system H protein
MSPESIPYRRARFGTRLPVTFRYTRAHYWLRPLEANVWQVGFTSFATRMLGDLVEYGFDVAIGQAVEAGQQIGWVEGFKALSDVYSVVSGEFLRQNPDLENDITLLDRDPYGRGWLYEARGQPDPDHLDVHGYIGVLDATIDRLLQSRHEETQSDD